MKIRSQKPEVRSQKSDKDTGRDEFKQIYSDALILLGLCDRTKKDLKDRLTKKGYPAVVVTKVINKLETEGHVNDELFAYKFTYEAVKRKYYGPDLIRQELQDKGITREIIDGAVFKIFKEYDEKSVARSAISKRLKVRSKKFITRSQKSEGRSQKEDAGSRKLEAGIHVEDIRVKEIRKLSDYLKRRGFSYDVIRDIIREIEKEYGI